MAILTKSTTYSRPPGKISKFHTFPGFPVAVGTLCKEDKYAVRAAQRKLKNWQKVRKIDTNVKQFFLQN